MTCAQLILTLSIPCLALLPVALLALLLILAETARVVYLRRHPATPWGSWPDYEDHLICEGLTLSGAALVCLLGSPPAVLSLLTLWI